MATVPYIDVATAQTFCFDERLGTTAWDNASAGDKLKALQQATNLIDTLTYIGHKNVDTQANEFPRLDDTVVPEEVQRATCEVALALLKGLDIEALEESTGIASEGVGDARRSYTKDGRRAMLGKNTGLPSATASRLLREWIEDPKRVRVDRTG